MSDSLTKKNRNNYRHPISQSSQDFNFNFNFYALNPDFTKSEGPIHT